VKSSRIGEDVSLPYIFGLFISGRQNVKSSQIYVDTNGGAEKVVSSRAVAFC